MTFNRLKIIGFLGRDGEQKVTPGGAHYTVLSIATKRSWKDAGGNWQERTEWHKAVVWGEGFSSFAASLPKGAHVQVEGPLYSRDYTSSDGVKQRVWECKAESILKLDRAERQESSAPAEEAGTDDAPL